MSNATAPAPAPVEKSSPGELGWEHYEDLTNISQRRFHFSIAFVSMLAVSLVLYLTLESLYQSFKRGKAVKEFTVFMVPLLVVQFISMVFQMRMAIPRWTSHQYKFSVATIDDFNGHNDDTPFDVWNREIFMEEFFVKFFCPDISCCVINIVSLSIVWIVIFQRKLLILQRHKFFVCSLVLVVASIPGSVWVSCRFNAIKGYQRVDIKNGGIGDDPANKAENQAMIDRYYWFLNKVALYNIICRLISIIFDLIAVVIVFYKVVEFRNPSASSNPDQVVKARRASEKLAADFRGSKKSVRGCPILELSKRMVFFPLIQIIVTLPTVLSYFIYEYDGGLFNCANRWPACLHLESYLVSEYFKTLLEPMSGLLLAAVLLSFQPRLIVRLKGILRSFYSRCGSLILAASRSRSHPDASKQQQQQQETAAENSNAGGESESSAGWTSDGGASLSIASSPSDADTMANVIGTSVNELEDDELVELLREQSTTRKMSGSHRSRGESASGDSAASSGRHDNANGTIHSPFAKRLSLEIQYAANIDTREVAGSP